MTRLRLAVRLAALCLLTAGFLAGLLAARGTCRLARRPQARVGPWFVRRWARGAARVIGLRIGSEGPVPSGRFVLVANHLSYLDVLLLASRAEAVFVARGDLASWPVLGFLCRRAGTIFIDRGRKRDLVRVLPRVEEVLAAGVGVILFPEGTSSGGDDVLPFRPSLLEAPAKRGLPVRYASLAYRTPPGSPPPGLTACWWGDMTFPDHFLDLLRLPWIEGRVVFGPEAVRDGDRKRLAATLRGAVRHLRLTSAS